MFYEKLLQVFVFTCLQCCLLLTEIDFFIFLGGQKHISCNCCKHLHKVLSVFD